MRAVAEAVTVLAARPRGFTASQLAAEVQSRGQAEYGPRRATYDLKKLRAKQLVRKVERTQALRGHSRRGACPDGAGRPARQGDQTLAGRCLPAAPPASSTLEPHGCRSALPCASWDYVAALRRTRNRGMKNIDNSFYIFRR